MQRDLSFPTLQNSRHTMCAHIRFFRISSASSSFVTLTGCRSGFQPRFLQYVFASLTNECECCAAISPFSSPTLQNLRHTMCAHTRSFPTSSALPTLSLRGTVLNVCKNRSLSADCMYANLFMHEGHTSQITRYATAAISSFSSPDITEFALRKSRV